MFTFSKTDKSLTVVSVVGGKSQSHTVSNTHPRWVEILDALRNRQFDLVLDLISVARAVEKYTENNVTVRDGVVYFKERALHGLDAERLIQFVKDGLPFLPLARFLERKAANPSFRAINELYKFLEHRGMPITPEGKILGYKGIRDDNYSVMGNTATIVLSGKTDSSGHILNTVGSEIRVDRSCVCDDYKQGCSPGLHIGSLEYAKGWGSKVVIVEFDPADVVSVPDDCNCQKLRACAYKVVGEYTERLPDTIDTRFVESSDVKVASKSEVNLKSSEYNDGNAQGQTDGRAHRARKHYVTDVDANGLTQKELDYIAGYNDGYAFARYGKK